VEATVEDLCPVAEWDEAARLAALEGYAILDTEREAGFDELAELAADIFDAPIAVVNFIADGRQWFKAEVGIGRRELPLDVSICRHAILQRGVFVVPDLAEDERFARNPLVDVAGGLRFYAGALLETPAGLPLGTVCVLDTEPRPRGITDRQRRALKALASQTMTQLEARRAAAALRASETRLSAVLESVSDGFYAIDTDWRVTLFNAAAERYFGRSRDEVIGRVLWDLFPQGAGTEFEARLRSVMAGGGPTVMQAPSAARPGRTVELRASPKAHGGVAVSFTDITERVAAEAALRESEAELRLVTEALPVMVSYIDAEERYRFVNGAYQRWFGVPPEAVVGKTVRELLGDEAYGLRRASIAAALRGEPQRFDAFTPRPDGTRRETEVEYAPRRAPGGAVVGFYVLVTDVQDRRETEQRLRRRSEQLQELAEVATAVARAPTLEATLDEITRAARRIVGAHQAVVSLTRGEDWSQVIPYLDLSDDYARWRGYDRPADGSGIYALVCETNRPIRLTQAELEAHPRWRGFGAHAADHPPMRGWLAAPLVGRDGRNLGLIQLSDKADGSEFDENDEAVTVQLARLASAAIEQAQTEGALRDSEARLRAVIEAAPVGLVFADASGRITGGNARVEEIIGHPVLPSPGVEAYRDWVGFHPDGRRVEGLEYPLARALAGEEKPELLVHYRRGDGRLTWIRFVAAAVLDGDGRVAGGVVASLDVDAERRAERHQRLLIDELNHRAKNLLAIIQGIAQQTFKGVAGADAARRAFEGRLAALAAAHNLLVRQNWEHAPLRQVATDALAPYATHPDRFVVEGPDLWLEPKTAVSLALALHELATNAQKYGALSVPEGRVEVRWRVEAARLKLVWRGRGGPPVEPPAARGFGSRMIERGLSAEFGGEVRIDFAREGVVCTVDAPLPDAGRAGASIGST